MGIAGFRWYGNQYREREYASPVEANWESGTHVDVLVEIGVEYEAVGRRYAHGCR